MITVDGSGLLKFASGPTSCGTFRFGTINLGTSGYYTPPSDGSYLTFSNSAVSYNGTTHTLQITLGTAGTSGHQTGTESTVPASALTLNLSSGIKDTGDNALTSYTCTTPSIRQF